MSAVASVMFLILIATSTASRLLLSQTGACYPDFNVCASGLQLPRDPSNNCEFPLCICGGFPNCKSYTNGCTDSGINDCICEPTGTVACTNIACFPYSDAACTSCVDGYTLTSNNECHDQLLACTEDAKLCSDGTAVGRDPLRNCEFFPCVGDPCGVPDIDCRLPTECIFDLCSDGWTCYGCGCEEHCTYEYAANNELRCSAVIPQDRVCPDPTTTLPVGPAPTLPPFCSVARYDCGWAGIGNPCCGGDPCASCENSQACAAILCLIGTHCCDNGLGDGQAICCPEVPEPPIELPIEPMVPSEAACATQNKCYNVMTQECDFIASCPAQEYCLTDESSPFYKKCDAYPEARCQFSGCGGCYEYFLNDEGILIEDCEINICSLVPETGPCEAAMDRYYYDETYNKCKQFMYGGCGGNGNNFQSKNDCNAACKIYFYGDPNPQ